MPERKRWFAGDDPTDESSRRFVASLAAAASGWSFTDLAEADTSSTSAPGDTGVAEVVAKVEVSGLTTARRNVWVRYDPDVRGLPVLTSQWTAGSDDFDDRDGYAYGCEPPDEEVDLWVSGVAATPEQCGGWAAAWLERQLRRPVCRREWDAPTNGWSTLIPRRRSGSPALVEWTFGDPEHVLDVRGGFRWDWLRHRPPSREVWERPPHDS